MMSLWTVCENPADYPGKFTARRWEITRQGERPTSDLLIADTLEAVRAMLPPGLIPMPRWAEDDPVIVEVWI